MPANNNSTVTVYLHLPKVVLNKIDRLAAQTERSRTRQILVILRKFLAEQKGAQ